MNAEQILSQIAYATIFSLALTVAYKFYQTKNGYLRKLLISYFLCVAWSFGAEWIYYIFLDAGYLRDLDIVFLHIVCHLPKAIVMIYLYRFLREPK